MHMLRNALKVLPLLAFAAAAHAQTAGTISFSANKTSATGSLAPVLTWSTSPVASSCKASGGWSGTKFASGSETLPTITANASYTLTCYWGGGAADVTWTKPTKNTDGSTLTDLAGYKVHFGNSTSALTQTKTPTALVLSRHRYRSRTHKPPHFLPVLCFSNTRASPRNG